MQLYMTSCSQAQPHQGEETQQAIKQGKPFKEIKCAQILQNVEQLKREFRVRKLF